MADLAVGLAKSVVEGTLSKAQAAIEQEGKLRRSAQRDLVFITGEFQMMQSFLKVANAERVENPVVVTWVRQIRDLAYDVEDCIEFVVHLDGDDRGCWWRMVPSWISWCVGSVAMPLDEAVDEIEQLKARVEDVSTRNSRYSLINDTGSKPASAEEQQPGASARAAAALSMLMGEGRRQHGDLAQLLAMKQDDDEGTGDDLPRVISVWGTSGDLGATSIIWKAYNDPQICESFTRRAWVKLTHPFNPHDFIGSIKDQFEANAIQGHGQLKKNVGLDILRRRRTSEATQDDYLEAVEKQLDDERYLVVLEDLSTLTDWDAIRKFFPPRNRRSCIIVSTQQSEVASLSVGHPYHILDLNQYSVDNSVYAFYKEGSQFLGDKGKMAVDSELKTGMELITKKSAAEEWIAKNPLVARAAEMNDLSQQIINARSKSIQVISVWGIASVGKSALVKSVFCSRILSDCSRALFERYGWVDIRHPFNLTDFARSLLLNISSGSLDAKEIAGRGISSKNPIVECQTILKKYKCLVVIDDLESTKEWDLIQAQLVSGFTNNCIITISSEASLARHCRGDKGEITFNVKSLGADSSYQLFKDKVVSAATSHGLPSSWFDEYAADLEELVSKCGGLPEVIVEIASSVGKKSVNRIDYVRFVSDNFMQDLERNREFDYLQGLFVWIRTYFRTCPDSLKPCIFYLSIFPRGCSIRRRRLVRRWIAEGYSRDSHEKSAELNGEKQFSDLLDLSIFQQLPTTFGDGMCVSCQVSGFIHEYILSTSMEENLVFELGGTTCTLTTQRSRRHLVILENWHRDKIMFDSIDFSRLRSLTVFGNWESFFISQSMKLLRVLDLENASDVKYEDLEKMVKWMSRLKFLSLRGRHEIKHLPGSMHHLRQLQTLDVRDTSIVTLPESITKLQKLQYIRVGRKNTQAPSAAPVPAVSSCSWFRRRGSLIGAEVPISVGGLTALHTLGIVNIAVSGKNSMVKELKKLTQLRKLGVSGINKHTSVQFFEALEVLVHLESLSVQLDKGYKICPDAIKLPLQNLRSLKLYGLDDMLPECISKLDKLAKLDLEMVTPMEKKCIKLLGELPQLRILRVKQQQGGELDFSVIDNEEEVDSYQMLKVLEVTCSFSTLCVEFGSQTMEKLEQLKIDCCNGPPQYRFSGLENLKGLKEVLIAKGFNAEKLKKQFDEDLKEVNKPVVKLV